MGSGVKDKIMGCLYVAIDEANEDRDGEPPLEKSPNTPIHGTADGLDSLGLINFLVAVEEEVERSLDVVIVLGDERALSQDPSPFRSLAALADYIELLVNESESVASQRD
jgi:acyl carrier protein